MTELFDLRRSGTLALLSFCWLAAVCVGAGSFYNSQGILPVIFAVIVSIAPTVTVAARRTHSAALIIFGLTLPLYPAILLYQWSGSLWQTDIHMLFFAVIAMLAVLADWRPIVAGAAVTAVHHLATDVLVPTYIFPEGASLDRVLFHAGIVVIETAVLVWLAARLEKLIVGQAQGREENAKLEMIAREERERTAHEQMTMITLIGGGLSALAEGDLRHAIRDSFPLAYEGLRSDFNDTTVHLCSMVRSVSDKAAGIHAGTTEIRAASDDLARRTEQQAASIEETSASMDEVTRMVRDTAQNAAEVRTAMIAAQHEATQGSAVVTRAVAAMDAIENSSAEINQIVNLIDGIAFQTNLLALNAGIEAARAGDSGRGFAVVANEVRALAQRSADAADEIKGLISTSHQQVRSGVSLVAETGTMLGRILETIGNISGSISVISQSAETQATNLQQINTVVGDMDRMTQQNAAMVEQSTAAARSLANEADELASLVSKFHVKDDPESAPSRMRIVGGR